MSKKNKRPGPEAIDLSKYKEHYEKAGFTGEPVIVERWANKEMKLTGKDEEDIERGALAIKIGEEWKKSPHVGPLYFKDNFRKLR